MSVSPDTIAQRVARGAEWLDANAPWWVQAIDLPTLDIAEGLDCICGQLLIPGAYAMADEGFIAAIGSQDVSAEHAALTAEWKRVIRARRGEA